MAKSAIELMLDKIEYSPTNAVPNKEGLPYVTHEGILQLGNIPIKVCVLNTGKRVIPKEELEKVFGVFGQLNGIKWN